MNKEKHRIAMEIFSRIQSALGGQFLKHVESQTPTPVDVELRRGRGTSSTRKVQASTPSEGEARVVGCNDATDKGDNSKEAIITRTAH
jgi:hypothetical protein